MILPFALALALALADLPDSNTCTVDSCDAGWCSVETPDGYLDVRNDNPARPLAEGDVLLCPVGTLDHYLNSPE
jgi:hypothetical protein